MTVIKICGIRTLEHALAAATAGADLIGFIFAPSKRQVTPVEADHIVRALRAHNAGQRVKTVGVFVNASVSALHAIAEQVGLDYVQLSGDELPELADSLTVPWLATIRLDGSMREHGWCERQPQALLHIDAHVPGSYGGSGQRADWQQAAALAAQRPILLAGGLTSQNVAAAIIEVQPWGVDVSSGVETDGVKDSAKIHAFVAAARGASLVHI